MKAQWTPYRQATGSNHARKEDVVHGICRSTHTCYFTLVALAAILAGGCGPKSAKFPTYTQPELLYVTAQRYTRLYVEVDVLEGVEVPQRWLDELQGFLSQHCDKPDGITMVRDAPIPASAVVGLPMPFVTLLCTDGPPAGESDQPAYLHIVFYDSRKWPHQRRVPPHMLSTCPTAIMCDVNCLFNTFKDRIAGSVLRHETGHMLGLCRNLEHGDGSHCRHHGCLMEYTPGIGSQIGLLLHIPWRGKLCAACREDLVISRQQTCQENLSFAGPFLVRHEDRYDVVRLPRCDLIATGTREKPYDWRNMLAQLKDGIRNGVENGVISHDAFQSKARNTLVWRDVVSPDGVMADSNEFCEILNQASQDPCPEIRKYARRLLNKPILAATENRSGT